MAGGNDARTYFDFDCDPGAGSGLASSAQAAYVVTFEEIGSDVIETGGGKLDLTDLIDFGSIFVAPQLVASSAFFLSGSAGFTHALLFAGAMGPSNFGPGLEEFFPDSSSGDRVGLEAGTGARSFFVPVGYQFGAPLSETSTYLDASFSSLGMTPGTYIYSWGSGAHADSFTVDIGVSPVPEPSTWAMMLVGLAGLGYARFRRKAAPRAVSA
jgi:hypothetical protein